MYAADAAAWDGLDADEVLAAFDRADRELDEEVRWFCIVLRICMPP
jgi:hypothetical protein